MKTAQKYGILFILLVSFHLIYKKSKDYATSLEIKKTNKIEFENRELKKLHSINDSIVNLAQSIVNQRVKDVDKIVEDHYNEIIK